MSRWPNWEPHEYQQLKHLIDAGLTNPQIAEIMDRPISAIQIKAQRKFGGNPNYRALKSKHAHLREPVMTYFLDHTWEETRKKFKLTQSELKSLFTVGYRIPELAHLRKDTREKSAWTTKQLQFLLTHSGLQPRDWIGKKLKRGNHICMKEKLAQLGVSSKNLNGLTLSQFREAFGREPEFVLETKAGPGRGGTPTYYKIIPWVVLDEWRRQRKIKCHPIMRKLIKSMALFQEWIHEGNALRKMKKICKGKTA